MESKENIFFSNQFGTVSDKRIILNYKTGSENLPIRQVSSVKFYHRRRIILGSILFLLSLSAVLFLYLDGLDFQYIESFIAIAVFVLTFPWAIYSWIGTRYILISVGGRNRKRLKVSRTKVKEGKEYVSAVQNSLISLS